MRKVGVDRAPFYRQFETHSGSKRGEGGPSPSPQGSKKMRTMIAKEVDRVQVGDARGDTWLGLFDEDGTINLLKGMNIIWGELE